MRIATALTVLGLLAAPAATFGQASPFTPLPAPAQTTDTPTVTVQPPATADTGGGLATWQQILIFGAALVLLVGIAWAIVSDARSKAPVKDSELAHPGQGGANRQNRSAKQKERARAKAMAGRKQRRQSRR